jgi:hypothetical protein
MMASRLRAAKARLSRLALLGRYVVVLTETVGANVVATSRAVVGVTTTLPELDEPAANAGGARFRTE